MRVILPFATRITLWNGGTHHSTRPRIRQQGKRRNRVDRSLHALFCGAVGLRVRVGYLPESEWPLQARTVQGSSLARSLEKGKRENQGRGER